MGAAASARRHVEEAAGRKLRGHVDGEVDVVLIIPLDVLVLEVLARGFIVRLAAVRRAVVSTVEERDRRARAADFHVAFEDIVACSYGLVDGLVVDMAWH